MKLFLKLASATIALLLLIIIIAIAIINPNDYKQQIQDQVKSHINRDLLISGDLGWSLYPVLGFKSGEVTLYNSPEFSQKTLLKVQETAISINLLPLFKGKIEVGQVILNGVEFNLITNKNGLSNLDNLQPKQVTTAVKPQTSTTDKSTTEKDQNKNAKKINLSDFVLSGISINNATFNIVDHQTNSTQNVTIKSMQLGHFAFDEISHFSLISHIKNNQIEAEIALQSDILIDAALTQLSLSNLNIDTEVKSQALLGSTLNSKLSTALTYAIKTQQLKIKAIKINNTLTGSELAGDIDINASNISLSENSNLQLDNLLIHSTLSGTLLDNHQLETSLQSVLQVNLQKQSATVSQFELENKLSGDSLSGHLNLSLQQISVSDFKNILLNKLNMVGQFVGATLPNGKINTHITADLAYALDAQKLTVSKMKSTLNDLSLKGDLSFVQQAIPKIRYNLKANVWDLNPYLSQKKSADNQAIAETKANSTAVTEKEPDLSILKRLDIEGNLTIDGLIYEDIKIGNITNHLTVKKGKAYLTPLTANLYNGSIYVNAWLDEANGKNKFKADTKIKNIKLMPLLKDAVKIDMLSGTANINLLANGQGLTATKIQREVNATGDFSILDGELYGINIPQEIRSLKATLTGKAAPTQANVKKTDFASLMGKFSVQKGILDNQNLIMLSPIMRLDGSGTVNTINQAINYKLGVTPLSHSDQKTEYLDLHGFTIPLLIQGTFTDPSFKLDTEGALKEQIKLNKEKLKAKVKDELKRQQEKLTGKSKEELKEKAKKLENKFKNLFQ